MGPAVPGASQQPRAPTPPRLCAPAQGEAYIIGLSANAFLGDEDQQLGFQFAVAAIACDFVLDLVDGNPLCGPENVGAYNVGAYRDSTGTEGAGNAQWVHR